MKKALALVLLGCAAHLGARAEGSADPYAAETPAARDARMAWWREARFGLFIHWGVYAVPGGVLSGRPVPGSGEWILRNQHVPVAEYRAFARDFNPTGYDPAAWAALARRAGMRYIVITAKHHEGFALYDSSVTDWDIADASPYGKDLLGPLVDAAHREGLHIGFYYSQAQDWVHPGGAKAGFAEGDGWDDAQKGSFDDYLAAIAVPQVRELLTRYPIDVLWWDTPHYMTPARAQPLIELLRLRPGILHNNRLGGGFKGDTETPEQQIPATGFKGRDWETCMTMNDTWGFKRQDGNWKSAETLIRNLVDIASKGGNYLLNVGPTAEGEIPTPCVERLEAIGRWMDVNHESIYGTQASPFHRLPWGRCTRKDRADGATLYLHVLDWPADRLLRVPGLRSDPSGVSVLATGAKLQWRRRNEALEIGLPLAAPDPVCSVLALSFPAAPDVEAVSLKQGADGSVVLPASMAELNNPGSADSLRLEQHGSPAGQNIGFWSDPRAWVRWTFKVQKPGYFDMVVSMANPSDASRFQVQLGPQRISATVGTTGDWQRYKQESIGRLRLEAAGQYELTIRPDTQGWRPINLESVVLKPVR